MFRFTLLILAMLLLAPAAHSADNILVASTLDDDASSAWAVYRNSDRENLLVFFAPRDADFESAAGVTTQGQIQAVRMLGNRFPIAVGAMGERGYVVFSPVYAEGQRLMRVYSVRAVPSAVGGLWTLQPGERFDMEPPIVTDGALIGFRATSEDLWALLKQDEQVTLLRLTPDGWQVVPVPESISTRRLELHAIGSDPVLVDRSGLEFIAYRLDPGDVLWTTIPYRLPFARNTQIISGDAALLVLDQQEDPDREGSRLRQWSNDGVFIIADGTDAPTGASYALLPSSTTLLGLQQAASGQEGEPIEIIELDARSAAERFRGAPSVTPPVSVEEFRFLVVMMVLVMSGVLVVVILPDRADAMQLPEGVALADPGRRLIATMLDALLVTTAVGALFNVSTADILTLAVIVQPDNSWAVFPLTIVTGVIYSSLCEMLFAATPGKMIARIRVVAAEPGLPHRARLWSVIVRNVIKWVLPPVAALALIDPETLHRGDRVSRSLVVMPRREPDPNPN